MEDKKQNVHVHVDTLENAALATAVNSCEKVDVPVRTPVELLVAHEVPQVDVLDDSTGVILSLPGNLTCQINSC